MSCKFYRALSFMFFGAVLALSLYSGFVYHAWAGLIGCAVGFISGTVFGKFKRSC